MVLPTPDRITPRISRPPLSNDLITDAVNRIAAMMDEAGPRGMTRSAIRAEFDQWFPRRRGSPVRSRMVRSGLRLHG